MPVVGASAVTTAMFKNAWPLITSKMPSAISEPNPSRLLGNHMPRHVKIPNSATRLSEPISPSSSPMTAMMKSVRWAGR